MVAIWPIIVCTSATLSIGRVFPLTFLEYLLTADCVIPRSSATFVSFNSCFSRSVFARRARIAGDTVLTATSQGVSNYPPNLLLCWENLYKDAVCHVIYDVCPDGSSSVITSRFHISFPLPSRHASLNRRMMK